MKVIVRTIRMINVYDGHIIIGEQHQTSACFQQLQ